MYNNRGAANLAVSNSLMVGELITPVIYHSKGKKKKTMFYSCKFHATDNRTSILTFLRGFSCEANRKLQLEHVRGEKKIDAVKIEKKDSLL